MSPRRTRARLIASIACAASLVAFTPREVPVAWHEDDRHDVPTKPKERDPNLTWGAANETLVRPVGRLVNPVRLGRRVGTIFGAQNVHDASNVNALGEVPSSTWFTNRIGLYPYAPERIVQGPGDGRGPSTDAAWTVIRAKTQGVTPGFDIKDAKGRVYLIKFDPPGELGTTSAADVITGRILHAIGYNVPDDAVVTFTRDRLQVAHDATLRDAAGIKRAMTAADLDTILARVDRLPDGSWLAIASRFLDGKPLGPFSYKGRRPDDPNDRLRHEDRRELRGLRMFCAWLNHWDMKEQNSLDMYVEENGRHYVRHHLIDFASTLGAPARGGAQPRFGMEYTVDFPAIGGRLLALGIHEDDWRRSRRPPGLEEVGYFESRGFQPMEWKPLQTNVAFANMNANDGYWAAKIISAFSDEHLLAAVSTGKYRDAEAAAYVARVLGQRRDIIARYWFDRVPPLDFFTVSSGTLRFHDLGTERHLYSNSGGHYRYRHRDGKRW
ncbi:MAG TPA: hypothetical protein VFD83_00395, partial [Candidatus Polarisedimenticolia bacterium]|nr:hypothetical protein [Candidatus Polarisedimenticolia bacterium]